MKNLLSVWSFQVVLSCLCTAASLNPVTAPVGGNVTIQCTHFFTRWSNKYFCRDSCAEENTLIQTETGKNPARRGRYSLHDKGSDFTVTIVDLRLSDSGTYICAVERLLMDNTYNYVTLQVIEDKKLTEVLTTSTFPFTSSSEMNRLFSSVRPTDHQISSTDSFVIVVTAEALALLLIGLPLVILVMRKKRKTEGLLPSSIKEFNPELYEQIKANLADGDTQTTVLYS